MPNPQKFFASFFQKRSAFLLAFLLLYSPLARAQLFGSAGLDPSWCRERTLRQTVAYVDDTVMVEGQTGWALRLADKLRGSLTPGERVTVVRLSPASGQSSEVWSGCWPGLSAAERQRLRGETFLFQRNPVDRLEDQQRFFLRDFGAALTAIYAGARRPAEQVHVDAAHPPDKQILRALASDGGRFASSAVPIRAIVYSDMAENSDLGSVFRPPPAAPVAYGERLGAFLRRGVFYAYGLDVDVTGGAGVPEATRAFWGTALRSMAAAVGGLGADLNVPNTLPVLARSYAVTLQLGGQALDGRLSLLVGEGGDLVDSTLGVSRLSSVVVTGTFRCGVETCRLDGSTAGGLATSSASEAVELSGPANGTLAGRLGVRGTSYLFPLRAEPAPGG